MMSANGYGPGGRSLVEIVDGELDDARGDFQALQACVTTDAQVLLEQKRTRHQHVSQVEGRPGSLARADPRGPSGTSARSWTKAGHLESTDEELPVLLADAAGEHDRAPDAQVIPMPAAWAQGGRRPDR